MNAWLEIVTEQVVYELISRGGGAIHNLIGLC